MSLFEIYNNVYYDYVNEELEKKCVEIYSKNTYLIKIPDSRKQEIKKEIVENLSFKQRMQIWYNFIGKMIF